MPFNPLIFRYLNYLFCFFLKVVFKLLGVLNDRLSLICVYDASWYFHILQILLSMHFGASSVSNDRTDFHLEIVQSLAHTTRSHRSQSSFVWALQVWSGRLGRMAILDAQGKGINNLANTVSFLKGLVYSDPQFPVD